VVLDGKPHATTCDPKKGWGVDWRSIWVFGINGTAKRLKLSSFLDNGDNDERQPS
jgi:hypothetical protein